jgi:hypothetical protein
VHERCSAGPFRWLCERIPPMDLDLVFFLAGIPFPFWPSGLAPCLSSAVAAPALLVSTSAGKPPSRVEHPPSVRPLAPQPSFGEGPSLSLAQHALLKASSCPSMIANRLFCLSPSARAPPSILSRRCLTVRVVVASLSASRPSPGQIVQSFFRFYLRYISTHRH